MTGYREAEAASLKGWTCEGRALWGGGAWRGEEGGKVGGMLSWGAMCAEPGSLDPPEATGICN